jgi:hypothetical protein
MADNSIFISALAFMLCMFGCDCGQDLSIREHFVSSSEAKAEYLADNSSWHYFDVCGFDYSEKQKDSIRSFILSQNRTNHRTGNQFYIFWKDCKDESQTIKSVMGINEANDYFIDHGIAQAVLSNDTVVTCLFYKNGNMIE